MNKTRKPILDVLRGDVPEHIPVWLMRQAGRYLPEYRDLRAKSKNFLNMCLTADLATEITMQPVRRFGMDAAILFADILLVPLALGRDLSFREGEGPYLPPLVDREDIEALFYQPEKVAAVFKTVSQVEKLLPDETVLIGFCGAPWTVACYMIDGNSKNDFSAAKNWAQHQPELLEKLIERLVDTSALYLGAQIEAGAEVVQIFDSWAGLLSGSAFDQFVIKPTAELVSRIHTKYPDIPVIGFPREAGENYEAYVKKSGVDGLSIDQSVSLSFAKEKLQSVKPLQGNLAPELLVEGGQNMLRRMEEILSTFGMRHIANLGHGVVPQTPPEHVGDLVRFVQEFRA